MKESPAFHKVPALLELYHQCYKQGTRLWGGVLPLSRKEVGVFYSPRAMFIFYEFLLTIELIAPSYLSQLVKVAKDPDSSWSTEIKFRTCKLKDGLNLLQIVLCEP